MKHLVIGYHGASRESVESLHRKEFDLSKSDPEGWLGRGLYFWEQDERQAWRWLKSRSIQVPAVLKAQINLSLGTLDLTTRTDIYEYRRFVKKFMTQGPIPAKLAQLLRDRPFGDYLWLPMFIRSYEEQSGIRVHAIRAIVLTGELAYHQFEERGASTLTAYTQPDDIEDSPESRVVTRMNIVVALLSKEPIEKGEILLDALT